MNRILVLFGGGDGGGYMIVNGRIVKIPPNNPEANTAIAAVQIFAASSLLKNAAFKKQGVALAQQLAASIGE